MLNFVSKAGTVADVTASVVVTETYARITNKAMSLVGIKPGSRVDFAEDNGQMYLVPVEEGGFKLSQNSTITSKKIHAVLEKGTYKVEEGQEVEGFTVFPLVPKEEKTKQEPEESDEYSPVEVPTMHKGAPAGSTSDIPDDMPY